MGLRHDLICEIVEETGTAKHMRRDRALSSKTVHEIYERLGLGEAGWNSDKTREDYLIEIMDHLGHEERKSMAGSSIPVSTAALRKIVDALQEHQQESSQQESSPDLNASKVLDKLRG